MNTSGFQLGTDEKVIAYGDMLYRINALNRDAGFGVVTNKRFVYFAVEAGLMKTLVSETAGNLIGGLLKDKTKLRFELKASEIREIAEKKIGFGRYINLITETKEYQVYPDGDREGWLTALNTMLKG